MHYFSDLLDKVLYMFRTGPLSIQLRSVTSFTSWSLYFCVYWGSWATGPVWTCGKI